MTIRVAIVDEHIMVGEGLARIVSSESDLSAAGIATSIVDALDLIERERPNVVLLDDRLPDGDGAEATTRILRRYPSIRVIMLTDSADADLLARAIEAGCSGFVGKDQPAAAVVEAVRTASRGESVTRADELAGLLGRMRNPCQGAVLALSARELEVLRLIARARPTNAIAKELFLSTHTVRNHVSSILNKLGAHSKLEAVAIARRDGIIATDEIGRTRGTTPSEPL